MKGHEFVVGAIFIIAIACVGILTIVVQDISILKGKSGELEVIFDKVAGLEKGHKVLASGMEVGRVHDLTLLPNGRVKARLHLMRPVPLRQGYQIRIQDTSALGGKEIDIYLGNPQAPLLTAEQLRSPLQGTSQPSFLSEASDLIADNREGVREIIRSIRQITTDIREARGTIGLLIKERALYDDLSATAANLRRVSEQLTKAEGTIGKLLYDSKIYNRLDQILADVKEITGRLRRGEGTMGKLLTDDGLYQEMRGTFSQAQQVAQNLEVITAKIRRGEGTVGKLITDDRLYVDARAVMAKAQSALDGIDRVMQRINAGHGVLGALVTDETMAADLKETLHSIRVVAQRIKNGEGTIGKLIKDDTLYKEIRRLVNDLSDSIEDTREQVPITTFTNVLFNAF